MKWALPILLCAFPALATTDPLPAEVDRASDFNFRQISEDYNAFVSSVNSNVATLSAGNVFTGENSFSGDYKTTFSTGTTGAQEVWISSGIVNIDNGIKVNGVKAMIFGGWYCSVSGGTSSGSNNPLTGAASCPSGFSSAVMFGTGGYLNCSSACQTLECTICYKIPDM